MPTKILVPYDGSSTSDRALAWAASEQARRTVELRVIQVFDPYPLVTAVLSVPSPASEEVLEGARAELRAHVAGFSKSASVEVVLAEKPGPAIVDEAQRWGAELIAMGTHGRSGVAHLVLGSVAEYVMRHAPCPLLTVREPGEKKTLEAPGLI